MNEEGNSLGTSLLIFLAGAAVGAAVVALTTPKNGPEVRRDLSDLGSKFKGKIDRIRRQCCCKEEEKEHGGEGQA